MALIILGGLLFLGNTAPEIKNHRIYEPRIEVEEWMTEPFVDSMEEPLEVEDWMCEPFKIK